MKNSTGRIRMHLWHPRRCDDNIHPRNTRHIVVYSLYAPSLCCSRSYTSAFLDHYIRYRRAPYIWLKLYMNFIETSKYLSVHKLKNWKIKCAIPVKASKLKPSWPNVPRTYIMAFFLKSSSIASAICLQSSVNPESIVLFMIQYAYILFEL